LSTSREQHQHSVVDAASDHGEPAAVSGDAVATDPDTVSLPAASRSRRRFGDTAVSGATVNLGGKLLGIVINFGSLAVLARLLEPADFGVVAMVWTVTAFLSVFSDLGLGLVTVQRPHVSQEQLSTLFWVNAGFGLLLGLITLALAPVLVWFYGDSRLLLATIALAAVFPLSALSVQHQALMKRNMRFRRLAVVRLAGKLAGAATGIAAALSGLGFWALVCQPLALAAGETIASWASMRWRPGPPRRCEDMRTMLGFGGRLTIHGVVGYLGNQLDKVLLGRFCGASVLGLYSVAYRLMMKPVALAGYSVGEAAIPAMSRAAPDQKAMRATYRRMFSLTCLWGLPVCLAGILWTRDIVLTLLGDRWVETTAILRILFLAALPRMLCASTGWVYVAGGRPDRMLRWQLMWAPFAACAFVLGLPYGALGVAGAFALANWIAFVPCFAYCFRGTAFAASDVVRPALAPALCSLFACLAAMACQEMLFPVVAPGPARLGLRLPFAMFCYSTTTALFVPLANEGFRRIARKWSQLFKWPRGDAKAIVSSHPGGKE
jgi:PST family polysaccharide transporter